MTRSMITARIRRWVGVGILMGSLGVAGAAAAEEADKTGTASGGLGRESRGQNRGADDHRENQPAPSSADKAKDTASTSSAGLGEKGRPRNTGGARGH